MVIYHGRSEGPLLRSSVYRYLVFDAFLSHGEEHVGMISVLGRQLELLLHLCASARKHFKLIACCDRCGATASVRGATSAFIS